MKHLLKKSSITQLSGKGLALLLALVMLSVCLVSTNTFAFLHLGTDGVLNTFQEGGFITAILLPGEQLNKEIKGGGASDSTDTDVTMVIFGKASDYESQVSGVTGVPVDENKSGSIMLYRVSDPGTGKYTVYILSGSQIYANPDSSGSFLGLSGASAVLCDNYDTTKVTNMSNLFAGCASLTPLDVSKFDTTNVTDMSSMFSGCSSLSALNVENFDTAGVTNMKEMFKGCSALTKLDLVGFDTHNVTDMYGMFWLCGELTTIFVSSDSWSTEKLEERSGDMFTGCTKIKGEQGTTYSEDHRDKEYARIDGGTVNTYGYFTEGIADLVMGPTLNKLIKGSNAANVLSVTFGKSKDYAAAVEGVEWVAADTASSGSIKLYRVPDENDASKYNVYILSPRQIYANSEIGNMEANASFDGLSGMKTIDFSNYDTSKVTMMNQMFQKCGSLTSVDLSGFDTSNVINTTYMFSQCTSLETLDLENFSMTALRGAGQMFYKCTNLKSLSVDFSKWTLDSVWPYGVDMGSMFAYCKELTDLDLRGLDTSAVASADMNQMFYGCSKLERLDLSDWDTSKVTNMWIMFADCTNLITIYVSDLWTTAAVTNGDSMFDGDEKLIGGAGTTFDGNATDKTYARIDEGASNPGYFTRKAVINTLKSGAPENNILAETVRGAGTANIALQVEEKEDEAAGSGNQLDETGSSSSTPPVTDETTPTQPQQPAGGDSSSVPSAAPSSSSPEQPAQPGAQQQETDPEQTAQQPDAGQEPKVPANGQEE